MAANPTKFQVEQLRVSVEMLRPNSWNTNQMTPENEAKLDVSIDEFGVYKPVVVRPHPSGEGYEILGGQHRWEAAKRKGLIDVPIVNVGPVSDVMAKKIGLVDNGRYGEDDTLALSRLLKELGTEDMASLLPYTDDEFENILAASSIDLNDLDKLDETEMPDLSGAGLGATHQVMRFKIPVEDVAWVTSAIERRQREQGFTTEDSMTNAGNAFVDLMKAYK
ncbi:MAG: ParB/RepB/Spo0J family partition protein [Pseudomonadota bacterium]|nr:ParB/RepB/Spo0J family partition protein [Pseudomonadota bacterium]